MDYFTPKTVWDLMGVPGICVFSTLLLMIVLFKSPVRLNDQGIEIDPDEDKEKMLLAQIESNVKQWFEYHKFDVKGSD
jgi:hypothetical protein